MKPLCFFLLTLTLCLQANASSRLGGPGLKPACEIQAQVSRASENIQGVISKTVGKKNLILQENLVVRVSKNLWLSRIKLKARIDKEVSWITDSLESVDHEIDPLLLSTNPSEIENKNLLLKARLIEIEEHIQYAQALAKAYENDVDAAHFKLGTESCKDPTPVESGPLIDLANQCAEITAIDIDQLSDEYCAEWLARRKAGVSISSEEGVKEEVKLREVKLVRHSLENTPAAPTQSPQPAPSEKPAVPGRFSESTPSKDPKDSKGPKGEGEQGKLQTAKNGSKAGKAELEGEMSALFEDKKATSPASGSEGEGSGFSSAAELEKEALGGLHKKKMKGSGMSEFLLRSEFKGDAHDFKILLRRLGQRQAKNKSITAKENGNWSEALNHLLQSLESSYRSDLLNLPGGAGEAKTKLIIGSLIDSGLKIPEPYQLGIQGIAKEMQAVLVNKETGVVTSLTPGSKPSSAEIYDPSIFYYDFLKSRKVKTGTSKGSLEIRTARSMTNSGPAGIVKDGSGGLNPCAHCTESQFPKFSSNYYAQTEEPSPWSHEGRPTSAQLGMPWVVEYESSGRKVPPGVVPKSANKVLLFEEKKDQEDYERQTSVDEKFDFISDLQIGALSKFIGSPRQKSLSNSYAHPEKIGEQDLKQLGQELQAHAEGNPDTRSLYFRGIRAFLNLDDIPLKDEGNQDAEAWKNAITNSIYKIRERAVTERQLNLLWDEIPGARRTIRAPRAFLEKLQKNPSALPKLLKISPTPASRKALVDLTIHAIQNTAPTPRVRSAPELLKPVWGLVDAGKIKLEDESREKTGKAKPRIQMDWGKNAPRSGDPSVIELPLDSIAQLMRLSTFGSRWHDSEAGWDSDDYEINTHGGIPTNGKGFALWTPEVSQHLLKNKVQLGAGIFDIYPKILAHRTGRGNYRGPKGDSIPEDLAILLDQVASQICPKYWEDPKDIQRCSVRSHLPPSALKFMTETHMALEVQGKILK